MRPSLSGLRRGWFYCDLRARQVVNGDAPGCEERQRAMRGAAEHSVRRGGAPKCRSKCSSHKPHHIRGTTGLARTLVSALQDRYPKEPGSPSYFFSQLKEFQNSQKSRDGRSPCTLRTTVLARMHLLSSGVADFPLLCRLRATVTRWRKGWRRRKVCARPPASSRRTRGARSARPTRAWRLIRFALTVAVTSSNEARPARPTRALAPKSERLPSGRHS